MQKKYIFGIGLSGALLTAALLWYLGLLGSSRSDAALARELQDRGPGLLLGSAVWTRSYESANAHPMKRSASLFALLGQNDDKALGVALDREKVEWLVIERAFANKSCSSSSSLCARMGRADLFNHLQAIAISPVWVIYRRRVSGIYMENDSRSLATFARKILSGEVIRENEWPSSAVRPRNVEVLVILRKGQEARLWRSARSSSLARGLMLAASVARTRWQERKAALGGDLQALLPNLSVEVSVIESDGRLIDMHQENAQLFLQPGHGVSFERKGTWFYRLPEFVNLSQAQGARLSFEKLFQEYGYDRDSYARKDFRLFRIAVFTLSLDETATKKAALN